MKQFLLSIAFTAFTITLLSAQYETVLFDYERLQFNENQPLPSETALLFTGIAPSDVSFVEVRIYSKKAAASSDVEPLAIGNWKRTNFSNKDNTFNAPITYKLNPGKVYDINIAYFVTMTEKERMEVYNYLTANLDTYIDQIFTTKNKSLKLIKNQRQVMADLNDVVSNGLAAYRNVTGIPFQGFSDLVSQKLETLEKTNLTKNTINTEDKKYNHLNYKNQIINDFKALIHREVRFLMNNDYAILKDSRYVDNYESDDKNGYFSFNIGYGGVHLGGELDNTSSFGNGVYVGIGFPLATSSIAPKIFRNASLNVGIFIKNFENDKNEELSGLVFNRPLYASLDYRLFQFIHLDLGAVLLEKSVENMDGTTTNSALVRPFIGINAKVNISLSFSK